MVKNLIGISLILIALIPFARLTGSQKDGLGSGGPVTGLMISAADEQFLDFLLKKDELFSYFLKNYESGFFVFSSEPNQLYSTVIVLESIEDIEYSNKISLKMRTEILERSFNYYNSRKNDNYFNPIYLYSFYRINTILGNDLGSDVKSDLVRFVNRFKVDKTGFTSVVNSDLISMKDTYNALLLLDSLNQDLTGYRKDVISYINLKQDFSDEENYYFIKIADILGGEASISSDIILNCVVKQYIPFGDNSYCSLILKDKNLLIFFPSLALLLLGYFLLIWR